MSYEEAIKTITLDADSSVGFYTGPPGVPGSTNPNYGKQYCFVKVTGAHIGGLCTAAANELPIGVLQNKPQKVGAAATIAIHGVSNAMSGAAVTAGSPVKLNASGQVINATPGADNAVYVGIALGSTSGSGQLVPVLLQIS